MLGVVAKERAEVGWQFFAVCLNGNAVRHIPKVGLCLVKLVLT